MNSEMRENQLLSERVHQLEAEIRRIRLIGAGVVVLLFLLLLSFRIQDHRHLTAERVVARSITLADSEGHPRAQLAVFPEGSGLEIYAPSGERRVQLFGTGAEATLNLYLPVTAVQEAASVNFFHDNLLVSSFRTDATRSSLEMHSKAANGTATLALQGTTASLLLSGSDEKVPRLLLSADPNQACTALGGEEESSAGGSFCLHSPGLPSLELADLVGNRAVVGVPHTADLSGDEGSAASLILKHKSGNKVRVTPAEPK